MRASGYTPQLMWSGRRVTNMWRGQRAALRLHSFSLRESLPHIVLLPFEDYHVSPLSSSSTAGGSVVGGCSITGKITGLQSHTMSAKGVWISLNWQWLPEEVHGGWAYKKGVIMRSGVRVMVGVICLSVHKSYQRGTWLQVFIDTGRSSARSRRNLSSCSSLSTTSNVLFAMTSDLSRAILKNAAYVLSLRNGQFVQLNKKALHWQAFAYISELLRLLLTRGLLTVPRSDFKNRGDCAFEVVAPKSLDQLLSQLGQL